MMFLFYFISRNRKKGNAHNFIVENKMCEKTDEISDKNALIPKEISYLLIAC